jgi:hypothetical protein
MMGEMISLTIQKHLKFGYIPVDSWFVPVENMRFIEKKRKTFIFETNGNRLAAADKQEMEKVHFIRTDRMEIPGGEPVPVYLKDLKFRVILYKQVFKNKDGLAGIRYPASNDETMEC